MSKERLEEIENKLLQATNEDDEDVVYASICAEAVLEDLQWTVGYAKEQAERVQELEDIIYQDKRQAVLEGMYEQNKRYRELLEFVDEELELVLHSNKGLIEKMFYIENSKRIISEALEE